MGQVIAYGTESQMQELSGNISDMPSVYSIRADEQPDEVVRLISEKSGAAEGVVLGPDLADPIAIAERIHAHDKNIAIVTLTGEAHFLEAQKKLLYSPFLGDLIKNLPADQSDHAMSVLRSLIDKGRKRRAYGDAMSQASRALRQVGARPFRPSPALLDRLLEYAPVGIVILTPESRIIGWNKEASAILGISEKTALQSKFLSYFSDSDSQRMQDLISRVQTVEESGQIEVVQKDSNNQSKQVIEIRLARGDGQDPDVLMAIIQDKTEQKRYERAIRDAREQAEIANQSKGRFLANMSHEIRTPIGVILGYLDLLDSEAESAADREEYISIIQRNGHQLLRLIDDILDLSKVEAGKLAITKNAIRVSDVLNDVIAASEYRAQENGLEFHVQVDEGVPDVIRTDGIRLRQILSNLVGNAIKFTEKGSVKMRVTYVNNCLQVKVIDTGIGISEQQARRLFRPFSQADASVTRRFGGTGLGLVLSKRLSEALGGRLELEKSVPGRGSTFRVAIPTPCLSGERVPVETTMLERPQSKERPLFGMKVLLVEDSVDNQRLIAKFVGRAGAQVHLAENGLEGYRFASKVDYDVILMDIQMPICDGLEATKKLRREGYSRPIIALTAHALEEEKKKSFAAGCTDHITKPVDRKALISALERYHPGID